MTDVLETAQIVPKVLDTVHKPVLCSFMGIVDVSAGVKYLVEHNIPNYSFPEAAVRAFASMTRFSDRLAPGRSQKRRHVTYAVDKAAVTAIIDAKLKDAEHVHLPEQEANEILSLYGFPLLKSRLIESEDEIEAALKLVGPPVVMKISSREIVHKFDVGGVILKIETLEQAREAYKKIIANVRRAEPKAIIDGVLMEKMAKGGIEVILGANQDPKFGPLCMFGLGGTFVEALKDVTFRLAPMWELSAEEMIRSIKAFRILQGVRGNPPSDIEAIKDCILRMSQLVSDHPRIVEMDLNPVIVYAEGQGCTIADSRIMLAR